MTGYRIEAGKTRHSYGRRLKYTLSPAERDAFIAALKQSGHKHIRVTTYEVKDPSPFAVAKDSR